MKPTLSIFIIAGTLIAGGLLFFLSSFGPSDKAASTTATSTITIGEATDLLEAEWKSVNDPNYSVDLHSDKTMTESYQAEGLEPLSGTWMIHLDKDSNLMLTTTFGNKSSTYRIKQVTQSYLNLIHTERNSELRFVKVN